MSGTVHEDLITIVQSCMKYFVSRQQCKGNLLLLLLHGKDQKFDRILLTAAYGSTAIEGKHFFVFVATIVTRKPNCYVNTYVASPAYC
jgi:hypothetical protein